VSIILGGALGIVGATTIVSHIFTTIIKHRRAK
jgi:hypothetical protein